MEFRDNAHHMICGYSFAFVDLNKTDKRNTEGDTEGERETKTERLS